MKFSKYNLLVSTKDADQTYLFNTFNGSCLEIDKFSSDAIASSSISMLDEETKRLFMKTGILIRDSLDEDKMFSYMNSKAKFESTHMTSTVLLTWSCNLKCVYCFQDHSNIIQTMGLDEADRYIKFVTSLAKSKGSKGISIVLFGGEPLLNIDIGFHIFDNVKKFCEEHQMIFSSSIVTNGTLLTSEIMEKLIDYNCKMIQITLDGVKSIHDSRRVYKNGEGSFDSTLKSLKMLNESNKIHTVIRVNVDKTNIGETYNLLDYIGANGVNLMNCTVDFGIVRGGTSACSGYSINCFSENEIGEVLYDLWNYAEKQGFKYNIRPMRRFVYCGLYGDSQYTIAPNCDVYKCWEHVGQKEHLMGKLNEKGNFVNITSAFFDWMSVDPLKNDECKECVYLPSCGGGCGVVSYNETGTYHSKGCFKVKGTVEKQVVKYVEGMIKKVLCSVEKCNTDLCSKEHIKCKDA